MGKADISNGCWNPKRKLGVTTHIVEIIELQFGQKRPYIVLYLKAFSCYCKLLLQCSSHFFFYAKRCKVSPKISQSSVFYKTGKKKYQFTQSIFSFFIYSGYASGLLRWPNTVFSYISVYLVNVIWKLRTSGCPKLAW